MHGKVCIVLDRNDGKWNKYTRERKRERFRCVVKKKTLKPGIK